MEVVEASMEAMEAFQLSIFTFTGFRQFQSTSIHFHKASMYLRELPRVSLTVALPTWGRRGNSFPSARDSR